jgi:hypothetical protein
MPELIEVEPVVHRLAAVICQPIRIVLGPAANVVYSAIVGQLNPVAEEFEMHLIAIPSAV